MIRRTIAVAVAVLALSGGARADTVWKEIRDGVVWVRAEKPTRISVRWRPVWSADGHMETLYFQDPTGRLIERRRVGFDEARGNCEFETGEAPGDYRLEIPGHSYRAYEVRIHGDAPSVFEPVKLHCGIHVPDEARYFFHVDAGTTFTLGGRFHGGVKRIDVHRNGEPRGVLWLFDHEERFGYPMHDKRVLAEAEGAMWRLTMKERGKVSFWVDETPNFFSQSKEAWFVPVRKPGVVRMKVGPEITGSAPGVGSVVEFAELPEKFYRALASLKMSSTNHYAFQDALESMSGEKKNGGIAWLNVYEKRMGIGNNLHLFEPHRKYSYGGVPVPSMMEGYRDLILDYLAVRRGKAGLSVRFSSFFDEPNSRFSSYEQYEEYFVQLAKAVRASEDPVVRSAKIAAPDTACFLNGPTKADARKRVGFEWAKRLVADHGDLVDAISWHEWQVRDLMALDCYGEAVDAAWSLAEGSPPKALIITQTNIMSGPHISPYEEETFYAALWWGSAVAHAAHGGHLTMINWSPAIDDPTTAKGLMDEKAQLKPVGHAMRFINEALLASVMPCASDSAEVPAVATVDVEKGLLSVFFVNKFDRRQSVDIAIVVPDALKGAEWSWKLVRMGEDVSVTTAAEGETKPADVVRWAQTVDGPALYALRFEKRR